MTFVPPELAWGSALLAGVLSFASPKESSQRKGDPRVGALRVPCATRNAGRLRNSGFALRQSSPTAPGLPALLSASHGDPKGVRAQALCLKTDFHGQPGKTAKNEILRRRSLAQTPSLPRPRHTRDSASRRAKRESRMLDSRLRGNDRTPVSPRVVSPGPLRGAEQRRNAGGLRRGLFEGRSPEFRSRPAFRVAQGTGAAGTDPGSPSFCLLFLGEARKSKTPRKGGTPSQLGTRGQSGIPSPSKLQTSVSKP